MEEKHLLERCTDYRFEFCAGRSAIASSRRSPALLRTALERSSTQWDACAYGFGPAAHLQRVCTGSFASMRSTIC